MVPATRRRTAALPALGEARAAADTPTLADTHTRADTRTLAGAAEIPAPAAVRAAARQVLAEAGRTPGHLALISPSDVTGAPDGHTGEEVLAVAARVGTTRLIDTVPLTFGGTR
ncbi:hypothetical protein [Kitasatospora sp. NPDC056181]|uniref:hypothetical protein n=1 Tax=Kitasatospora sp. NPDC056181 TaxID=3345737 RepID=UPI0035D63411